MFKTSKQQVSFVAFAVVLAGLALASIVKFTDPYTAPWLTFAFFYVCLFVVTLGAGTLLGLGIRQWLSPKIFVLNFHTSFRQALLISILTIASVLLLADRLLFWWVELSLILFLLSVEIFLNLKI